MEDESLLKEIFREAILGVTEVTAKQVVDRLTLEMVHSIPEFETAIWDDLCHGLTHELQKNNLLIMQCEDTPGAFSRTYRAKVGVIPDLDAFFQALREALVKAHALGWNEGLQEWVLEGPADIS